MNTDFDLTDCGAAGRIINWEAAQLCGGADTGAFALALDQVP